MLKKINENSYLYNFMDKYRIKPYILSKKSLELNKKILILLKDFAHIINMDSLDDFCKKYKTEKENLSQIDFIINLSGYDSDEKIQIVNIKSLVLITNNSFMLDLFEKESPFCYIHPLGINVNKNPKNNNNMTQKDFLNLCYNFDNKDHLFIQNYLKSILNLVKNNNINEEILIDVLINYFNLYKIENETILDLLDILIEKKVKNPILNNFLEKNAAHIIKKKKMFEKFCEITDANIFTNNVLLVHILNNNDYFKKCLNKFGYDKLDEIFSALYNDKILNKNQSNHTVKDNLKEILIIAPVLLSRKIDVLKELEDKGELKKIINKDNDFLNRIFLECKFHKLLSKDNYDFLTYLEKEYNYYYMLSNYNTNSDINTINLITDKIDLNENFSEKDFLLYILNQSSPIPDQVFINILNQCCFSKNKGIINGFFKNNRLKSNNQLYEILLTNLNTDKRKKVLNNEEGIELMSYLLSNDFKNENNITLSNKEIIEIFKKRRKSIYKNVMDAFVENFILDNYFSKDINHSKDIKIAKKRI